jgi:hypothetical protein
VFENVANLKYLDTTFTNQTCNQEGTKNILNTAKAHSRSVQNVLLSRLLSNKHGEGPLQLSSEHFAFPLAV